MPYMDCWGDMVHEPDRDGGDNRYLIADIDRCLLIRRSNVPIGEQPRWRTHFQGKVLVVTDGRASVAAGGMASRVMLDAVLHHVVSTIPWLFAAPMAEHNEADKARTLDHLEYVIACCQAHLRKAAAIYGITGPFASDVTLAYVVWPHLYVAHAGDSRCYLFRSHRLYQLTSDFGDHGDLRPAPERDMSRLSWTGPVSDAGPAPGRMPGESRAEIHHVPLQKGDRVLLCTHGLIRHLDNNAIAGALDAETLSANVCARLLSSFREAGGTGSASLSICRLGAAGEDPGQGP